MWPTKTQISLYIHPIWQGFPFIPLWMVYRSACKSIQYGKVSLLSLFGWATDQPVHPSSMARVLFYPSLDGLQISLYIHPVWQGFSFIPLWMVYRSACTSIQYGKGSLLSLFGWSTDQPVHPSSMARVLFYPSLDGLQISLYIHPVWQRFPFIPLWMVYRSACTSIQYGKGSLLSLFGWSTDQPVHPSSMAKVPFYPSLDGLQISLYIHPVWQRFPFIPIWMA